MHNDYTSVYNYGLQVDIPCPHFNYMSYTTCWVEGSCLKSNMEKEAYSATKLREMNLILLTVPHANYCQTACPCRRQCRRKIDWLYAFSWYILSGSIVELDLYFAILSFQYAYCIYAVFGGCCAQGKYDLGTQVEYFQHNLWTAELVEVGTLWTGKYNLPKSWKVFSEPHKSYSQVGNERESRMHEFPSHVYNLHDISRTHYKESFIFHSSCQNISGGSVQGKQWRETLGMPKLTWRIAYTYI